MVQGADGRDHVMLLLKGDIEIPSDLRGLEYHSYHENVAEVTNRIQQFFGTHGVLCPANLNPRGCW